MSVHPTLGLEDGWLVDDVEHLRFYRDQAPPRSGVWRRQLAIDVRSWKPVAFWVVSAALILGGAATERLWLVGHGLVLLGLYLFMLRSVVTLMRESRLVPARISGPLSRHPIAASMRTTQVTLQVDGAAVPQEVALDAAPAEQLLAQHGQLDAQVLYHPKGGQFLFVLAVRPCAPEQGNVPLQPPASAAPIRPRSRHLRATAAVALLAGAMAYWSVSRTSPAGPIAQGDDMVEAWVPLVRALVDQGTRDPAELVLGLTYLDLELASGEQVYGRLPRAIETVAHVLERPAAEVARDVVARWTQPAQVPAILEALGRLRPKLAALPGVRRVGELRADEAAEVAAQLRSYASMRGVPLPRTRTPSEPWLALLRELEQQGVTDPAVLMFVVRFTRVQLRTGDTLPPLDDEAGYETVAAHTGADVTELRSRLLERFLHMGQELPSGRVSALEQATAARALLSRLETVSSVEETHAVLPPPPVKPHVVGTALLPPPWASFPEPPSSLRWRMGPGEDVMDTWWPFWRGLSLEQRARYFEVHPPPAEWQAWAELATSEE